MHYIQSNALNRTIYVCMCVFNLRTCFFTSDSSMKRFDFMRMLNSSFPGGGLTCSFQDHQLSEYIQVKKRVAKEVPTKQAVSVVGPQNNGF